MLKDVSVAAATPVPMLDFSRQYTALREDLLAAMTEVCDSQRFVGGPQIERFEHAAAAACGTTFAAGCASGTDALWLAMAAAGVRAGDKVLTTPFSFFATARRLSTAYLIGTASAILRVGATPVFADVDPATFNLSPTAAATVLKREDNRINAILPVHLYGQCADMDLDTGLHSLGIRVIEDAAQAFGASWREQPAGSLGVAAAFSFYPTKNLSAMGEAGLVTTALQDVDERVRSLRAHGMKVRYFHEEVGWNARMDTLQAAVLEIKLRHVAAGNQRRRELAARYDQLFTAAGLTGASTADGIVLPWTDPRATHVFHQYVIRAPRRDDLRAYLTERKIGSEVYYPLCLHQQKALASLGYKTGDFPHAERAAAEVLALPMYPELREDEQDIVVDAIGRFYAP